MVNLVTYADSNYLQHAAVMIHSLEAVASPTTDYRVFLFVSDCPKELIDQAKKGFAHLPANVQVEVTGLERKLPPSLLPKRGNVTAAIYNKILIYDALPGSITRLVFIDADIVLCRDPAELFHMALGSLPIAAVREKLYLMPDQTSTRKETLGLKSYRDYFNSGVMVVDLEKWRELDISNRALQFAVEKWHATPYHDQDAFNAVISGQWLALSPLWNPRGLNEVEFQAQNTSVLTNWDIYERSLQYLVHYSGPLKPWLFLTEHPKKQLYWDFLARSGFSSYRPPDRDLSNILKKYARRLKRVLERRKLIQ